MGMEGVGDDGSFSAESLTFPPPAAWWTLSREPHLDWTWLKSSLTLGIMTYKTTRSFAFRKKTRGELEIDHIVSAVSPKIIPAKMPQFFISPRHDRSRFTAKKTRVQLLNVWQTNRWTHIKAGCQTVKAGKKKKQQKKRKREKLHTWPPLGVCFRLSLEPHFDWTWAKSSFSLKIWT